MYKTQVKKQLVEVEVQICTCDICSGDISGEYFSMRAVRVPPVSDLRMASPYPVNSSTHLDVCLDCVVKNGAAIKLLLDTKLKSELDNQQPKESIWVGVADKYIATSKYGKTV